MRVDELSAAQRLGHRVDGEVARGEVGLERPARQRQEVDAARWSATTRQPPKRLRQRERRAAGRARSAFAARCGVAVERDVEVVRRPAEQPVAHGAADEPGPLARQRLAQRDQARGTRARDAAGDLVVDRAEPARPLLGEDPLAALRADQDRLLAALDAGRHRTVMLSIETVPTSGRRTPPISTSALLVSARRTPSA